MADLPLHEASIGLLRHWSDTKFAPHTVYFLNFGQSNQLFSWLVYVLALALPIGWASKVVVALSLFLLPVSAAHFADYLQGSRWTALLVAPVGIGWLFFWGLVQNIVGMVALLALLPLVDRFAAKPTRAGAVAVCGAMIALNFAHQAMQVVASAALVLCALEPTISSRGRSLGLRSIPLGFSLVLGYAENTYAWHVAGPLHNGAETFLTHSLFHKLASISGVLFGGYEPFIRNLMLALALAPVALLAMQRTRAAPRGAPGWLARLHAWRFELTAGLLFAVYLAAPVQVRSTTLVYHRFLPPAWALTAICAGAGARLPGFVRRPVVGLLCAVVPVATLLTAWPTFVDSDRMYKDLDALIPYVEPGSSLLAVNVGPAPHQNRLWNPVVGAGHVVAVRGGRGLFDYTQSTLSPVAQRPEKQWPDAVLRVNDHPYALRPGWDFKLFRYLFVLTPDPNLAAAVDLALKGQAELLANKGDWYLFESRMPLVPIDWDEEDLPEPKPLTLRRQLEMVSEKLDKQIAEDPESAAAPVPLFPMRSPPRELAH